MPTNKNARRFEKLSPSEFMRARRPHLFSDTEVAEQAQLDRSTFEYHLETLTARKQELDFERFARKLAEKEICPNLIPQTGPTGGGDSKVDSETYPVSAEISNRWYYANATGREGATERWAFAFSTKKDWRAKVRADIESIVSTHRDHKVAYFITSRFVKDKDRAAVEDELRKEHNLDVRILDRTWIVEKVFDNKRQRLAIETLRLDIPLTPAPRKGPRDISRDAELKELEEQIGDPDRYVGLDYQLVEDALQAALLARGLELPRAEVEGRFDRAERLAKERGTTQRHLRYVYNRAWTYFWWYEDNAAFVEIYETVENLARGTSQMADLELLQNLWQLLYTVVRNGKIDRTECQLDEHTAVLRSELDRVQKHENRPSTTLQAKARQLLIQLTESYGDKANLKRVFRDFRSIFNKSQGLLDFPVKNFIDILMELGDLLPDDPEFDKLYESVLEVTRERENRAVSGRMLLRRGVQKLDGGKPYEAISFLGRAQQDLAMHECRGEMIAALGLCADAYETAGLLWAARATILLAANQALKEFWEHGEITRMALLSLRKLIWLELKLGRIPCVLAWIETFLIMNSAVELDQGRRQRLAEEWSSLDGVLGLLLLRTDLFELKDLAFLPNVLEHFHLDLSWLALLYALGYENELRTTGAIPPEETPERALELFNEWLIQPAASELPESPEFLDKQIIELRSTVLGCEIVAKVPNNNGSLFLTEDILAGVEAFLSTALKAKLFPHTARLELRIVPTDFMDEPLTFTVTTAPHTVIEVHHPKEGSTSDENTSAFKDKMMELISWITAYIAMPSDKSGKALTGMVRDERAFGRALLIASVRTMMGNILGSSPKIRISDWKPAKTEGKQYPLLRKERWNCSTPVEEGKTERKPEEEPVTWGKGEPPPELFDMERLKHRDVKVFSLINIDLWNKAGWSGTAYATSADPNEPPFLILGFKNADVAASIFVGWLEEIGPEDTDETLRVSIITGISSDNPAEYRVIVSTNPKRLTRVKEIHFVVVARINTMTPPDSANLDRFLASYKEKQRYILMPGLFGERGFEAWATKLGILKRELIVRPAWQIGEHDPDICGINEDDKIIIPAGVENAPVQAALMRKKKRKSDSDSFLDQTAKLKPNNKTGRNDPCYCGSSKKYKKCHGK
jgi:hypothetical protein